MLFAQHRCFLEMFLGKGRMEETETGTAQHDKQDYHQDYYNKPTHMLIECYVNAV